MKVYRLKNKHGIIRGLSGAAVEDRWFKYRKVNKWEYKGRKVR